MEVTTRPASPSDTSRAHDIHHTAYRNVVEKQFGTWDAKAQDRFFRDDWRDGADFDVIIYQGVACGYTSIEDRGTSLHVRELVIAPEFQGRGIGTHILKEVMDQAAHRHIPVQLGTFHKNPAVQLYRNLGFEETDRTDTHVLLQWTESPLSK